MDYLNKYLTQQNFIDIAKELQIEPAVLKAVAKVESLESGFFKDGLPVILFERHIFSKLTNGKFDKQYPLLSNKKPGNYGKQSEQYPKLYSASSLSKENALKSCSWGKFQIMGFNYNLCNYKKLEDFVDDMYKSEVYHLLAFKNFIVNQNLVKYLQQKQFDKFAYYYNGPNYKINKYDEKLLLTYNSLNNT